MPQFTVQTNGQAMIVVSSTAALFSDAAYASSVTLPQSINSDATYFTRDANPSVVIRALDGSTLYSSPVNAGANAQIAPALSSGQVVASAASAAQSAGLLDSGQETVHRLVASNTGGTPVLTSQQARFFYFTARKSFTATQVKFATGGTAAGATPTLVKFGVYAVNADGSLTLLSATANDTTLLAATFTSYTKALASSVTITAGQRYAVAALVVTAAAAPTLVAAISGLPAAEVGTSAPTLAKTATGQSDLAASYSAGSLVDTAWVAYGVVLP